jgi:hypothetical protein
METELHPDNMNRVEDVSLIRPCKPLIKILKERKVLSKDE